MTQFSRSTHLKMAACLRSARNRIISGQSIYVCFAISKCKNHSVKIKMYLRDWIYVMLGEQMTVTAWLRDNNTDVYDALTGDVYTSEKNIDEYTSEKNIAEYRAAWIDHMIKILEE